MWPHLLWIFVGLGKTGQLAIFWQHESCLAVKTKCISHLRMFAQALPPSVTAEVELWKWWGSPKKRGDFDLKWKMILWTTVIKSVTKFYRVVNFWVWKDQPKNMVHQIDPFLKSPMLVKSHWGKNQLFVHLMLEKWENEILKMWILWKMRFWKANFVKKWDSDIVNFVKNDI